MQVFSAVVFCVMAYIIKVDREVIMIVFGVVVIVLIKILPWFGEYLNRRR